MAGAVSYNSNKISHAMAAVAALHTMILPIQNLTLLLNNDDKTKITSLSGYPQLRTA